MDGIDIAERNDQRPIREHLDPKGGAAQLDGSPLHHAFRLFPCVLSEMSVRLHAVEAGTERTVALFLSDGAGVADDAGRLGVLEYAAG